MYRENTRCILNAEMIIYSDDIDVISVQKYIKQQLSKLKNLKIYLEISNC